MKKDFRFPDPIKHNWLKYLKLTYSPFKEKGTPAKSTILSGVYRIFSKMWWGKI